MSAVCDEYFSLAKLDHSSKETEIGFSELCIPNQLKAAVFILGLVAFSGAFFFAGSMLIFEYRKKMAWSWKTRAASFLTMAAAGQVVSYIMHLVGSQSLGRYTVFFIQMAFLLTNTMFKINIWYVATANIRNNTVATTTNSSTRKVLLALGVIVSIAFPLFTSTIVPMVLYDDKWALNWAYSFSICVVGLVGLVLIFTLHFLTKTMLTGCEQAASSESGSPEAMAPMIAKLKKSLIWYRFLVVVLCVVCVFPVWMGSTQTEKDPGMRGQFYFHFFFWELFLFVCSILILWGQMKANSQESPKASAEKNSSEGRNSEHKGSAGDGQRRSSKSSFPSSSSKSSFPSFSIEQLNPTRLTTIEDNV